MWETFVVKVVVVERGNLPDKPDKPRSRAVEATDWWLREDDASSGAGSSGAGGSGAGGSGAGSSDAGSNGAGWIFVDDESFTSPPEWTVL